MLNNDNLYKFGLLILIIILAIIIDNTKIMITDTTLLLVTSLISAVLGISIKIPPQDKDNE